MSETVSYPIHLSTTGQVYGREIGESLGIVEGSCVRARFVVLDLVAAIRNFFGGEVKEYSQLLIQSRTQARARMCEAAKALGADAVIEMRFTTSTIAEGTSEVLAYGTAVKFARP